MAKETEWESVAANNLKTEYGMEKNSSLTYEQWKKLRCLMLASRNFWEKKHLYNFKTDESTWQRLKEHQYPLEQNSIPNSIIQNEKNTLCHILDRILDMKSHNYSH